VVEAAYEVLKERYPRSFHHGEKFSQEPQSQRIRFPHEIAKEEGRDGATCVDVALLMCAVLEACRLSPVFVLVGTGRDIAHALVGCWLDEKVRLGALRDRALMQVGIVTPNGIIRMRSVEGQGADAGVRGEQSAVGDGRDGIY